MMKYKVKYFEITDDKKIILHIKKPFFKSISQVLSYFDYKFNDNFESYVSSGLDIKGNIILIFLLRSFERDIKPYINNLGDVDDE